MASILPILLLGGAAVVVMKKKKKKSSKVSMTPVIEQPVEGLPEMVAPPKKKKAGSATVKKRQQALDDTGYNPGKIDGKMGPNTRKAIMAFQKDAGITVDARWGPETAAAMAQALKMAFEGVGRATYGQIGKMLDKFKGAFESFGRGKEESTDAMAVEDTGLPPRTLEDQTDKLIVLAVLYDNPNFNPEKHPIEQILMELQGIHGINMTGRWDLATRILVNELLSTEGEA